MFGKIYTCSLLHCNKNNHICNKSALELLLLSLLFPSSTTGAAAATAAVSAFLRVLPLRPGLQLRYHLAQVLQNILP